MGLKVLWWWSRHRASSLVLQAAETLQRAGNGRVEFEGVAWNSNTVALIRAARGHLQLVLFQTFARSVETLGSEVRAFVKCWKPRCGGRAKRCEPMCGQSVGFQ